MCTVTYIPLQNNDFILTSSRDVSFDREKAMLPKKYIEDGVKLFYPKDGKAGGTWIGSSSKNRLICLLNGGFENHISKNKYRKSRGKIVLELLKLEDLLQGLIAIDLNNIEPFTLVIVTWFDKLTLTEFVWDGAEKHTKKLPQAEQIWSSSTLYTEEMKTMRKDWFENWKNQKKCDAKGILQFHHEAGIGNSKVDVLMKRPKVGTVSITQVIKKNNDLQMIYEEILE